MKCKIKKIDYSFEKFVLKTLNKIRGDMNGNK